MKNTLSLLFLFLTSLYGYGQKYTIEGTLPDRSSNGQYIFLTKFCLEGESRIVIDSVEVKKDKFFFKGRMKEDPCLVSLSIPGKGMIAYYFVLEPGEIKIVVNSEYELCCTGTILNEEHSDAIIHPLQALAKADSLGSKKNRILLTGGRWTEDDEFAYRTAFPLELAGLMQEKQLKFTESHIQYPEIVLPYLDFYYRNKEPKAKKILAQLPEDMIRRLERAKERSDKAIAEYIKKNGMPKIQYVENTPEAVKVGKPFSDFSGETPDGKQVTLSEVVKNNKLVLIDFWASWCGPCMQEMPNIAELYRQYKGKGLEIIGISSDQSAQRWAETIQKKGMIWPQIRSAGEDRIGSTYGIKFIPYTVLIDQNGTIIARKLKGEELQQKIKDILQ